MLAVAAVIAGAFEQSGILPGNDSLFTTVTGVFVFDVLYRYVLLRPELETKVEHWIATSSGGSRTPDWSSG